MVSQFFSNTDETVLVSFGASHAVTAAPKTTNATTFFMINYYGG
jgi:hypothetical protein